MPLWAARKLRTADSVSESAAAKLTSVIKSFGSNVGAASRPGCSEAARWVLWL